MSIHFLLFQPITSEPAVTLSRGQPSGESVMTLNKGQPSVDTVLSMNSTVQPEQRKSTIGVRKPQTKRSGVSMSYITILTLKNMLTRR